MSNDLSRQPDQVHVIGAGLAGSEASLTLASLGIPVRLVEQKPRARTPAQQSDLLCELVCSNSFRGAALSNAVGLLKEEMRRAGSFVMRAAALTQVPAGGALAVDRNCFAEHMTRLIEEHPLIERVEQVVDRLGDERPLIVATGPLTGGALALDIERCVGQSGLSYYDAIAPAIVAESIDWSQVFRASRWGKGETDEAQRAYANCPMDQEQYERFVALVKTARKVEPRSFEAPRFFEGCLPIDVMAERGERTLAFGPMKPVGLVDPRTARRPYAVVQLRQEDEAATAYNMVGFQTRLTVGEQQRVFRSIPGLERAEFCRYGAVHRNTFVDAPRLLDETMQLVSAPGLYFAGQIAGVEGYVESAAAGLLCARFVAERRGGREPRLPPPTTALGGLLAHLRGRGSDYQPSNITFSMLEPWQGIRLRRRARYEAMAQRALADLGAWLEART
ncbi:MAG: methylenetetrahydrofolate--tRNA-(uracil(54)-C(5))-methyltransferase (FADH(2)-oxidizing) TrmFO [Polyangiaceae bacterium]|nr:methylenetetrahydrofolate--tRNA-(uracil(54)-C(5))-methyltransferase (FADH(2)-oxidizing) TrmFO [Polyangiaceae bacterium]